MFKFKISFWLDGQVVSAKVTASCREEALATAQLKYGWGHGFQIDGRV